MEKEKIQAHFRIYLLLVLAIILVLPLANAEFYVIIKSNSFNPSPIEKNGCTVTNLTSYISNYYKFNCTGSSYESQRSTAMMTLFYNGTLNDTGTISKLQTVDSLDIGSRAYKISSYTSAGSFTSASSSLTYNSSSSGHRVSSWSDLTAFMDVAGGVATLSFHTPSGSTLNTVTANPTQTIRSFEIGTDTSSDEKTAPASSTLSYSSTGGQPNSGTASLLILVNTTANYTSTFATNTFWGSFENSSIPLFTQTPSITLNSPVNNFASIINNNVIFNISATVVSGNLSNATLFLNGTANETISITGLSNTTTFTKSFSSYGTVTWRVLVCDSNSNCDISDERNVLLQQITENSRSYNASTYETLVENFIINISTSPSVTVTSAKINYNGTNYTSTVSYDGLNYIISNSIPIPSVIGSSSVTRDFYWIITSTDTGLGSSAVTITSSSNQTVNAIALALCGGSFNISVLNFTLYNEKTDTIISKSNLSTFQGTFFYGLSSSSKIKNYSVNNQSMANNTYDFCVQSYIAPLFVDLDLSYDALGFFDRSYYLRDAQLTNITNLINLYLIPEDVGQKFFFDVRRGGAVFPNAIVTISKYFEGVGSYKTIAKKVADGDGKFTEYLELDKQYRYLVSDGSQSYGLIDRSSICSAAPCEETLQVEDTDTDIFGSYYDLFAQNISYALNYSVDTKTVYFTYVDLTGLAAYARLEVRRLSLNSSGETICNVFSYSSFGSMSCNLTSYSGDFVANVYISRSPEVFIDYITIFVQDIYEQVGDTGILVVIFLLFLTIGAFWSDPKLGMLVIVVDLVLLRLVQLLPLSWRAISGIAIACLMIIGLMRGEQ